MRNYVYMIYNGYFGNKRKINTTHSKFVMISTLQRNQSKQKLHIGEEGWQRLWYQNKSQ